MDVVEAARRCMHPVYPIKVAEHNGRALTIVINARAFAMPAADGLDDTSKDTLHPANVFFGFGKKALMPLLKTNAFEQNSSLSLLLTIAWPNVTSEEMLAVITLLDNVEQSATIGEKVLDDLRDHLFGLVPVFHQEDGDGQERY